MPFRPPTPTGDTRTFHGLPVPAQRQPRVPYQPKVNPTPVKPPFGMTQEEFDTPGMGLSPPPEINIPLEPNYTPLPPSAFEGPFPAEVGGMPEPWMGPQTGPPPHAPPIATNPFGPTNPSLPNPFVGSGPGPGTLPLPNPNPFGGSR